MRTVGIRLVKWALSALPLVAGAAMRSPSVPLVSVDPFFSVWSSADRLTDAETVHRTGVEQAISVILDADGKSWRLCGAASANLPALPQRSLEVRPTQTVYTFGEGALAVELRFSTAKLAEDLELFSRPVAYVTAKVKGAKGWKLRASIASALATNDDRAPMVTNRCTVAGLPAVSIGRRDQKPLSGSGGCARCDWGWAWLVGPSAPAADEAHFILAYDDIASIQFFGDDLPAWWRRNGMAFTDMLAAAEAEREHVLARLDAFDAELRADLEKLGGPACADRACRAYRQVFAACKLVADRNGQPLYFSKDDNANGRIGAVDVLYRQFSQFLFLSPTLARATLAPVLLYAAHPRWTRPFAPYDLGRYPFANRQCPGGGETAKCESRRVAVEASANMIIALAALAEGEGSAAFASAWWPTVTKWAQDLEKFDFDPGSRLGADDSAGRLAHNANLAVKTGMALAAYGRLAQMRGDCDTAAHYAGLAQKMAPRGMEGAADGGVFLQALSDRALWRKYAARDRNRLQLYAPILHKVADKVPEAERTFNLASFNLRCPADRGDNAWARRLPRIVKVIRSHGFDIMGVQEATTRQRRELVAALPGWGYVGLGKRRGNQGESCGIFYRTDRFECLSVDDFWLSETPRVPGSCSWRTSEPRICTHGRFRDLRTGAVFSYFNTHLDHISNTARVKGMETILDEIRRTAQGETVFLSGDMNTSLQFMSEAGRARIRAVKGPLQPAVPGIEHPILSVFRLLFDAIARSETPYEGPFNTFSAYRRENISRIDYIFTTGNVRVLRHVTCADRPDGKFPSDHDAVMVTVDLR